MASIMKIERLKAGISQNALAQELQLSRNAIRHYEEKPGDCPGKVLVKLAQIYGCTTDHLLIEVSGDEKGQI